MRKIRIGIDVDNVIADFSQGFIEEFNRITSKTLKREEITKWNLDMLIEELYKEHMLRFENLQLNGSKLVELGYSGKRIKLILDDVTKLVVTNQLSNDEASIMEYISRRHRI